MVRHDEINEIIQQLCDSRYDMPTKKIADIDMVKPPVDDLYKRAALYFLIPYLDFSSMNVTQETDDYEYKFLIVCINEYIDVSSWAETNIQEEMKLETKFMEEYEHETFNQILVDTIIKYREVFVSPEFVLWFIKHSERNNEKRFEL